MDTSALSFAFSAVFTPINMLVILGGTILGIFIGAMPGMSSPMGLSIMLPFTFQLHGYAGIMMLLGIFCGSIYGGSISASLLNTPGTAASAATCLDAYPMSVQMRQPGRSLGISTFSSLCGGLFSCVVLVFGATYLAKVALNFKSPEYFALAFFGISIITSVSGKSVIKGLMGGILGLLFATVGVDNFTGTYRFTFGSSFLKGGLAMIPILIGVFAFAQVLKTIEEKYNEQPLHERVKIERVFPRKDDLKTIAPTVVRSSILGTFIGAVPGTGGDIASWVGYNMAKRFSKHPEKFGHGSPEGIAGSEAANNAIAGGAFVPLLALGIPGDARYRGHDGRIDDAGYRLRAVPVHRGTRQGLHRVHCSVCCQYPDGYLRFLDDSCFRQGHRCTQQISGACHHDILHYRHLRIEPLSGGSFPDAHHGCDRLCPDQAGLCYAAYHSGPGPRIPGREKCPPQY